MPDLRLPSLLHPGPLRHSLQRWIDWDAVHSNVAAGTVDAVALIATAARSGRSFAFLEGANMRKLHQSHIVDYVHAKLANEHARTSAASSLARSSSPEAKSSIPRPDLRRLAAEEAQIAPFESDLRSPSPSVAASSLGSADESRGGYRSRQRVGGRGGGEGAVSQHPAAGRANP